MSDLLADIQTSLATVERTLDALTSRGHDVAAFELSKAHFGARVRASWPASLAPLVSALRRVHADEGLGFSAEERAAIASAIATLDGVINV